MNEKLYHYQGSTSAYIYSFYATHDEGEKIVLEIKRQRATTEKDPIHFSRTEIKVATFEEYFKE